MEIPTVTADDLLRKIEDGDAFAALALQLATTISTWRDHDLDLAGVVDGGRRSCDVPEDLTGGTGVALAAAACLGRFAPFDARSSDPRAAGLPNPLPISRPLSAGPEEGREGP